MDDSYKDLYLFVLKYFNNEAREYNVFPFHPTSTSYKDKYRELKNHFIIESRES